MARARADHARGVAAFTRRRESAARRARAGRAPPPVGRDAEVAGERQREPPAHRRALDRRDHRLGETAERAHAVGATSAPASGTRAAARARRPAPAPPARPRAPRRRPRPRPTPRRGHPAARHPGGFCPTPPPERHPGDAVTHRELDGGTGGGAADGGSGVARARGSGAAGLTRAELRAQVAPEDLAHRVLRQLGDEADLPRAS